MEAQPAAEDVLVAKFDFEAASATELTLKRGEVIRVINRDQSGWAQGELSDGRKGWFPWEFVVTRKEFEAAEARKRKKSMKNMMAAAPAYAEAADPAAAQATPLSPRQGQPAPSSSPTKEKDTLRKHHHKHEDKKEKEEKEATAAAAPAPAPAAPAVAATTTVVAAAAAATASPVKSAAPAAAAASASATPLSKPPHPPAVTSPAPTPSPSAVGMAQSPETPRAATLPKVAPAERRPSEPSSGVLLAFVSQADQAKLWHTLMSTPAVKSTDSSTSPPPQGPEEEQPQVADDDSNRPVNTTSMLREYTEQMEVLMLRLYTESGRQTANFAPRKIERAREMSMDVVQHKIVMLRQIFVQYSMMGEMLCMVLDSLFKLSDKFAEPSPVAKPPSSKDQAHEDVEDSKHLAPGQEAEELTDTSPLFFIYKTLRCVLEANAKNPRTCGEIAKLPPRIRDGFFAKLHFQNRPAIRQQAALCLASLSTLQLDTIVQQFSMKLVSCKSNDQFREYVTFSDASAHLAFGVSEPAQLEPTNHFFNAVAITMEKVDRAVLRVSMCRSLATIVDNVFFARGTKRCPEFEEKYATKFWNCFARIFDTARKWLKVDKTRVVASRLLSAMLTADQAFLVVHGEDYLSTLLPELRDPQTRKVLLEHLLLLFKRVFPNKTVPGECMLFWQGFCDNVLSKVLPTKAESKKIGFPVNGEVAVLVNILTEMARRGIRIGDQKMIRSSLSGDCTQDLRALLFKSFSNVYLESPESLTESIERMYPMVALFWTDFHLDGSLSRPIMVCFPYLCKPDDQQRIAEKIVPLMSDPSSETELMATNAIINWIKVKPSTNLPIVMKCMLNNMKGFTEMSVERLLTYVKPVCTILDVSQKFFADGASSSMDPAVWAGIREECEGTCLSLFLSNEPVVWTKALLMAESLKKPVFVAIEEKVEHAPYLIDSFRDVEGSSAAGWFAHLSSFLKERGGLKGEYGRAIGWAWERLYKSWSPKQQNWGNILRFLLLSIRVVQDSDVRVEQAYLSDAVSMYFSGGEDVAFAFSDLIPEMNSSCLEPLSALIAAENEKHSGNARRASRSRPFFQLESVITVLSRMIMNMPVDIYARSDVTRSLYRSFISFWLETSSIGLDGYHPAIKSQACTIFQAFLALEGSPQLLEDAAKRPGSFTIREKRFTESVFSLLSKLLATAGGGPSKSSTFEVAIIKAVTVLLQLSEIHTEFIDSTVFQFLGDALRIGPHMAEDVSFSLFWVLKRNPKYLGTFVDKSFQFRSKPDESLVYMQALTKNVSEDMSAWRAVFPASRMLSFFLLQMALSPLADGASAATKALNILVSHNGSPYKADVVPLIPLLKDNQAYLQSRNAQIVCSLISEKNSDDSAEFLFHMSQMLDALDESNKCIALTLLPDWARNFKVLVAKKDESKIKQFIDSLIVITSKCSGPSMQPLVEQLWQSIVSSGTSDVVDAALSHLVRLTEAEVEDKKQNAAVSIGLLYISRTKNVHSVFNYLTAQLRSYTPPSFGAPKDFLEALFAHPIAVRFEGGAKEQRAFALLADLLCEQHEHVGPHLAHILQAAYTLYSASRSERLLVKEAESVLCSVLGRVLVHGNDEAKKTAGEIVSKKNKWAAEDLKQILALVAPIFPKMRGQWAELAIDWGLMLVDEETAVDSLHLSHILTETYDQPKVTKLLLCLLKFVLYWQPLQRGVVCDTLLHLPAELHTNHSLWLSVARAGGSLLFTSSVSQYVQGCELLRFAFRAVPNGPESAKLVSELESLWPSPAEVATVVVRGLAHQSTYQHALWLCETLASGPARPSSNALLQIASLVHALLIYIKSMEAAPNALKFATTCGAASMKPLAEAFARSDMRTVPVHLQRDAADLLGDFFTVFAQVFSARTDWLLALDLVLVLLRRGQKRWRAPLLEILSRLVNLSHLPTRDQLLQLSELVIFFTHSSDASVSGSAIRALTYVLKNIPEGVAAKLFDCIRTMPQEIYPPQRDQDVFVGDTEDDIRTNVLACSKKIVSVVLSLPVPTLLTESFVDQRHSDFKSFRQAEPKKEDVLSPGKRPAPRRGATTRRMFDTLTPDERK